MSILFTPVVLTVFSVAIATIRLQNVGEFHEAGFCSSVRIDCANSRKEFPHGTVTPSRWVRRSFGHLRALLFDKRSQF